MPPIALDVFRSHDSPPHLRTPVWAVEDDEAFRQSVEAVLERAPGALCAASFADPESALAALDEGAPPPKVVLMDASTFRSPGSKGVRARSRRWWRKGEGG
jgi:DNA-binding NtrC family response regulator